MTPVSPPQKAAVRAKAIELGFDACGFAKAATVSPEAVEQYASWIGEGKNACMDYAAKYPNLRDNPTELFPGAKTMICVALNYFPTELQDPNHPQFAYYAYGEDYHEVLREKLNGLASYLQENFGAESRPCVDTAPVRERYWAQQAGIGMIGRNNTLIIPGKGSFFFLGELITTLEIEPDAPCKLSCGDCNICVDKCPTGALDDTGALDARKCLSCQLIECRGEIPTDVAERIGNRVYGCDECQKCCPHNSSSAPTAESRFHPTEAFLNLTLQQILAMDHEGFLKIFRHSAVRRAKLTGLLRNAHLLKSKIT